MNRKKLLYIILNAIVRRRNFIIPFFICCTSCTLDRQGRAIRRETVKDRSCAIRFIAEHKENPGRYLVFYSNGHFYYFEMLPRLLVVFGRMNYYAGQYEERRDTLFVKYHDNIEPAGMADYFMMDTARQLLVYPNKQGGGSEYLITKKLRPDKKGLMRGM